MSDSDPNRHERVRPVRAPSAGPSGHSVDVLLVDSRAVVRHGLRAVIEQEPDLVVVAQAATVREATSLDVTPDVIVTDLPDRKYGDVINGLRALFHGSSILAFVPVDDPVEVRSILAAGADGCLRESAQSADLLAAIRAVAAGERYLEPSLGVQLARLQRAEDATVALSPEEQHVLLLLVLGHTNVDVARLCNISLRTAETHRAHIQLKLDRHTRADLVEYARETGLVRFDPQ